MYISIKAFWAAIAIASATPVFSSEIILSVSGDVQPSSTSDTWGFDLASLKTLPSESFETTTIWTEGNQTFEGASLAGLLKHVGAAPGTLRAIALNDYSVEIPTTDAVENGPIVAYLRNGSEMSVRDKGPLWIIYPFDDNPNYKTEKHYSRSIWQLSRIEVVAAD